MSQRQTVLSMLADRWCCGVDFIDAHILRYTARIGEARKQGYTITRRPCESHSHDVQMWEWRLLATPEPPDDGEKCDACSSRLSHTSACPYRKVGADNELRLSL